MTKSSNGPVQKSRMTATNALITYKPTGCQELHNGKYTKTDPFGNKQKKKKKDHQENFAIINPDPRCGLVV